MNVTQETVFENITPETLASTIPVKRNRRGRPSTKKDNQNTAPTTLTTGASSRREHVLQSDDANGVIPTTVEETFDLHIHILRRDVVPKASRRSKSSKGKKIEPLMYGPIQLPVSPPVNFKDFEKLLINEIDHVVSPNQLMTSTFQYKLIIPANSPRFPLRNDAQLLAMYRAICKVKANKSKDVLLEMGPPRHEVTANSLPVVSFCHSSFNFAHNSTAAMGKR